MFELSIFLLIFVIGLLLACWYGRRTKRFRWSEYIALFLLPFFSLIWLTFKYGLIILALYFTSAVLGMFIEGLIGWAYHKTLASKLWEYKRFPIPAKGYTSWLTPPFWGLIGVATFLLVKAFGI